MGSEELTPFVYLGREQEAHRSSVQACALRTCESTAKSRSKVGGIHLSGGVDSEDRMMKVWRA
jgi:hypothetical protein